MQLQNWIENKIRKQGRDTEEEMVNISNYKISYKARYLQRLKICSACVVIKKNENEKEEEEEE